MDCSMKASKFFVEYNCKFIAMYKSISSCLKFIQRKGLQCDLDNMVRIFDSDGNEYHPFTGNIIN